MVSEPLRPRKPLSIMHLASFQNQKLPTNFTEDPKSLYLKCFDLTREVIKEPFQGIGKPEHLKRLSGNVWSRRISHEHRMVYEVFDSLIVVAAYRYHYE